MKKLLGTITLILAAALIILGCPVADPLEQLFGTVSITGTPETGHTLTARFSGTEAVNWQWIREGQDIAGATGATFIPTQTGEHQVRASARGFFSITSDAVTVIYRQLPGNVSITGTPQIGETLTAVYDGTETVTWQWILEGQDISGATGAAFVPAQIGMHSVRASAPGFRPRTSAGVMVTDPTRLNFTGTLSFTGEQFAGEPLTAHYTGGPETGFTWHWFLDGLAIAETSNTIASPVAGIYEVEIRLPTHNPLRSDPIRVYASPPLTGIGPGTFTATGEGIGFAAYLGEGGKWEKKPDPEKEGLPVLVTVTVSNRRITVVEIAGEGESDDEFNPLRTHLPGVFIERNTFDIPADQVPHFNLSFGLQDIVSGATLSFNGIVEAGNDALDKIRNQ